MKVTPVQLKLNFESSGGPRSKGLHLSDIYGALLRDMEPERYGRGDDPTDRFELGFALEHMLELGLRARGAFRPEEHCTEEGIYFSPDMILEEDDKIILGEIKCTWLSSKDVPREPRIDSFPPKFEKYFIQMKGYCYNLGTPYARLFVFFVNGRYDCRNRDQPPTPELLVWDITFTAQEMEENWRMIINYAKHKGMLP